MYEFKTPRMGQRRTAEFQVSTRKKSAEVKARTCRLLMGSADSVWCTGLQNGEESQRDSLEASNQRVGKTRPDVTNKFLVWQVLML